MRSAEDSKFVGAGLALEDSISMARRSKEEIAQRDYAGEKMKGLFRLVACFSCAITHREGPLGMMLPSDDDVLDTKSIRWGIKGHRVESSINHRHAEVKKRTRTDVKTAMAFQDQRRRSRFSQDMSLV